MKIYDVRIIDQTYMNSCDSKNMPILTSLW